MKYQDTENTVNGHVVGIKVGTPLKDVKAPEDDGYDHLRNQTTRVGTLLQDEKNEESIPIEE
ncbi:MAG: hypothetical protein JJT76_06915 [Clostridiaceae bacterium]|nr:hypothetical protein [Clostridiaceae bacterium]